VRDLLGLADAESINRFLNALVSSDVVAGVAVLEALEERGRDARAFLDQVVESVRSALVDAASSTGSHPAADLVAAARRLARIDPERAGAGGLRLQLELALFPEAGGSRPMTWAVASPVAQPSPTAEPAPAPEPTPPVSTEAPVEAKAERPATARSTRAERSAEPEPEAVTTPAPEPLAVAAATAEPQTMEATAESPPAEELVADPPAAEPPEDSVAPPAADAAEPAAVPAAVPAAAPGSDLERLRRLWPEIVTQLSAHPPTKPLITACRPISVEDRTVILGFPEGMGFLRDVAERRRPVLEEGISRFLGHPVAVRCVATNLDVLPQLPGDEEAAFVLAEARRIFGEDTVDATEVH
ncbi:MAG: hypothetical protein L0221_09515, partial [Chloroflexi bacterium]|nr:hypothetical protein [Chloroflexota bacterium]